MATVLGRALGTALGRVLGADFTSSLFASVLALTAGRPVFTADYYAVDGVTGKVASFIDWNDPTHTLAQATSANQVALPAAHADFAGQLCATFDGGTSARIYQSNRPAAYWSLLCNGPFWAYSTLTFTFATSFQILYETFSASAAGEFTCGSNGTGVNQNVWRPTNLGLSASSAIAIDTPLVFRHSLASAQSPQRALKTSLVAAASTTLGGSDQTTLTPLVFGARASLGFPLRARVRHLLMLFPALDVAGQSLVEQYILQDSGIAA